jgi:hypothetical protein
MSVGEKHVAAVSKELVDGYIKSCSETAGWILKPDQEKLTCSRAYYVLFASITEFLAKVKDVNGSVALIVEDLSCNPMFVAIVEYQENPDKDMPGNWNYYFSFDLADAANCTKSYKTSNNQFRAISVDVAANQYKFGFEFTDTTNISEQTDIVMSTIIANAARCIREWVEENSVETTPHSTEIEGIAVIEAMVDANGKKFFSITPSGELKNIIKDDAAIEGKKEVEKKSKKAA